MSGWARRRSIWRGITRLVQFRADGLDEFGDTPQAFVNSLTPLLAFPLVGAAMGLAHGDGYETLLRALMSGIALLAPPVLSHVLASLWRREALWLRYAVAFNWCESAVFLAVLILLVVLTRRPELFRAAGTLPGLYWVVLQGFLARRALRVSISRAILLVVAVNVGFFFLVAGPLLLGDVLADVMRGG